MISDDGYDTDSEDEQYGEFIESLRSPAVKMEKLTEGQQPEDTEEVKDTAHLQFVQLWKMRTKTFG